MFFIAQYTDHRDRFLYIYIYNINIYIEIHWLISSLIIHEYIFNNYTTSLSRI